MAGECAMHEEKLLGVELVIVVSGEDGVAEDAVKVSDSRIMNMCGVEVVVRSDMDVRHTVP